MLFYEANLAALVLLNIVLFIRHHVKRPVRSDSSYGTILPQEDETEDRLSKRRSFLSSYLLVYLLAAAADWLQGPHIYAIYRYDKQLAETMTAALYATGFVSGAVSSTFVGQIADRLGRRTACLAYCAVYMLCCMSMLSDSLPILFLGRICGGIGTTLLYTSFESWMITEYHHQELEAAGLSLSTVFGRQTTGNSIVAILSGVAGEGLVSLSGTRKAPFLLAALMSLLAAVAMLTIWSENYGGKKDESGEATSESIAWAVEKIWKDKKIFALTTASSFYEGMMYLFVFFWTAAITSARTRAGLTDTAPYGTIFSCFMCSMMAGSQIFTWASTSQDTGSTSNILQIAMTASSLSLMSTIISRREDLIFWAFCLVELCIGLYFPSMSFLKSNIIEDSSRAKLYSLMRVPLNMFVIAAHSLAEEGDHHRNNIFLVFGGGVLIAFIIVRRFID